MLKFADRYLELQAILAGMSEELEVIKDAIKTALRNGEAVTASNGEVFYLETRETFDYKRSGKGGLLAFIRNHPEVDAANLIRGDNAGIKKLEESLRAELAYTVKTTEALKHK